MNMRIWYWNLNGSKFLEIIKVREHSTEVALYFKYEIYSINKIQVPEMNTKYNMGPVLFMISEEYLWW